MRTPRWIGFSRCMTSRQYSGGAETVSGEVSSVVSTNSLCKVVQRLILLGPHDNFCFVCGSGMELFGCQTCENCYHAECMTPSLDPDEVPKFWFCPHCVQRDLHIPPSESETATLQTPTPAYPTPISPVTVQVKDTGPILPFSEELVQQQSKESREHQSSPKSRPRPTDSEAPQVKNRPGRPRRSYSPPRKKSKYSAFSAEVDKALSILYAELETAAKHGKSEGSLQDKVQGLEQTLRLQEGQMKLTYRELELLRKARSEEQEASSRLRTEILELREKVTKLEDMVEKKDGELRDWRMKLRTMMGAELE
jgi:hypothetical protein